MQMVPLVVTLLAMAILAAPPAAGAQPAGKVYHIGVLSIGSPPIPPEPPLAQLVEALRNLDYVEGRNVAFHWRWAANQVDALPGLAADLVRLNVNIILTVGTDAAKAVKGATDTIPVVFAIGSDPVRHGLVTSLARPGGNVTGVTTTSIGPLSGKLLQILKEAIPGLTKLGVLWEDLHVRPPSPHRWDEARRLGIEVHFVEMRTSDDLEQAFEEARRARVGALWLNDSAVLRRNRTKIGSLGLQHQLPTVGTSSDYAPAGVLITYGQDLKEFAQRRAWLVDRILRGARPADLPVEQPTKLELIVNMKTAKALGLMIPQSVLLRADGVISSVREPTFSPESNPQDRAFDQGLRDLGYIVGRNIVLEVRGARGKIERLPDLAAELVRLKVDVILVASTPATLAALNATRMIPIVILLAAGVG